MKKTRTFRFKEGVNRKTGKKYQLLRCNVILPEHYSNQLKMQIDIPCDSSGRVKTYKNKATGKPFIYAKLGAYEYEQKQGRKNNNILMDTGFKR